jgi:hypothetical protein
MRKPGGPSVAHRRGRALNETQLPGLTLHGSKYADGQAGRDDERFSRAERTVLVVTAGVALWNMGVAYLAGLLLYHAAQRGLLRL